ncbi:MAG: tRNA pseudouridine(54/55) synthase Pus10 [Candidatus Thorarchaeota archaeon]|nr:tRNA pseudouridine(54/55) synthase Pus10 [Candidatus Thorarchaeota archaeon]
MDLSTDGLILSKAIEIMKKQPVCDQCLGRQFAWLGTDTTNRERGRSMKLLLAMKADESIKSGKREEGVHLLKLLSVQGSFQPAIALAKRNSVQIESQRVCALCSYEGRSLFDLIPSVAQHVQADIQGIEFSSFLVGCKPIPELTEREDEIRAELGLLHGETLKADFNRELGKALDEALEQEVDFDQPDVVFVYNMLKDELEVKLNPIFISGRYRKLKRGIPQSRWDCRKCGGKGCKTCNQTGRMYPDSISEYIGEPILEASRGRRFKFHGAGREDIDVLMLGTGRPFVVEVSEPRIRRLALEKLMKNINKRARKKVEVFGLEISSRSVAQSYKEGASENVKEYEAIIQTAGPVTEEALEVAARKLSGVTIEQRTPKRVSHRRSDLVRSKQIHKVELSQRRDGKVQAFFRVQGGTYIKELITGDQGGTTPSLSELLETPCLCVELDVVGIYSGHTP